MSHEFPRRRDVRDMCEELLHALMANYNNDNEEFDQDFLTDVRDAMREGVPFSDAVGFHVPDVDLSMFALDEFAHDPMDEDVSDMFPLIDLLEGQPSFG